MSAFDIRPGAVFHFVWRAVLGGHHHVGQLKKMRLLIWVRGWVPFCRPFVGPGSWMVLRCFPVGIQRGVNVL